MLVVRRGRSQHRSGDDRIEAQAGISVDACPDFPALDVAPGRRSTAARPEIAIDAFHHAVYAAGAGLAY